MRRVDDLSKELREIEACEKANEPKKKLTFMKKLVLNIILLAFAVGVLTAYAVNSVGKLIRMGRTVGGYDAHDKDVFAAFVGILLIISAAMYKLTKPKGGKGFDSGRFKLCIMAVAGILMIAIFIALCVKSI